MENIPNPVKKIDIQVQKVPYKMNPKRPTPRHIIIKMPKVKDKERILKAARGKQLVTYKGAPIDCQLIYQQKLCKPERTGKKYSVMKSKDLKPRLQNSYHLESKDI